MKIVVFGPFKRTGALHGESVVDLSRAYAKYLQERTVEPKLYPGDVISGGTAAGTAADSSELLPDKTSAPERFLKPGDVVEMRSPSIGSLRTLVVGKRK